MQRMQRYRPSTATIAVVSLAAVVFAASVAVPALGGPKALSEANPVKIAKRLTVKRVNKTARRALRIAKRADRRSRRVSAKKGPQGPPGIQSTSTVDGPTVSTCASGGPATCTVVSSKAECPPGSTPTGGGFDAGIRVFVAHARVSGNGYFAIFVEANEFFGSEVSAQAVCASGPGISAARASRSGAKRWERRKLAEVRAQER